MSYGSDRSVVLRASFPRQNYLLGEEIPLVIEVQNQRDRSIQVADIDLGFQVKVFDAQGTPLEGTLDAPTSFSFIFAETPVPPGATHPFHYLLARFVRITTPSSYRVEVRADPGLQKGWADVPAVQTVVQIGLPTAAQAARIGGQLAERREGDFSACDIPVFVPILEQLGQSADPQLKGRLFQGLRNTAGLASTRVMVEWLRTAKLPGLSQLGPEVLLRMGATRLLLGESRQRSELDRQSWSPALDLSARAVALELIADPDRNRSGIGAEMLRKVAEPQDGTRLVAAITSIIESVRQPRNEANPDPAAELSRVLRRLVDQGYSLRTRSPRTSGEVYLYFRQLQGARTERPAGWRKMLDTYAASPFADLRAAAIASIPEPVPRDCEPLVKRASVDPDVVVEMAATKEARINKFWD